MDSNAAELELIKAPALMKMVCKEESMPDSPYFFEIFFDPMLLEGSTEFL
jgi:hypothetical protein